MMRHNCKLALWAGVSLCAMGTSAMAQNAPAAEAASASDQAIIVTGSRVTRNGDSSPSPVTVIQTSDILTTQPGSNLADALNVLPVFAGSRGAGSNPSTGGSASGGNGAANQLNLRNMGITRTLVLMDGLRVPPTLFNGAVDVDLIPQMLVQRVDMVTGGVSAVYGSDAVSGVVNYVLNHKFNGLRVEGSAGTSEYADARQVEIGGAWGRDVGENGHFEASYQFRNNTGIKRRSDRPWMNLVGIAGLGTAASPFQLYSDLRQKDYPAGGLITSGPLTGQVFASNGVLSPFVNGIATSTAALQLGGGGGTWDSSLLQPMRAHQVFARYDHNFNPALRGYVQFSGNFKQNEMWAEYVRLNNVRLRSDNPFLTTAQQTALAAGGATFTFRNTMSEGEDRRQHTTSNSDQWVFATGLAGDLGAWDWGFDFTHSQATLRTKVENNLNQQRLAAALDVVSTANGPACYAATQSATAGAYANCVPLNPFGPTAASAAALNYIYGTTNYRAVTTMNNLSGQISGSPFSTWAGEVKTALSGEWRLLAFTASSDATSQNFADCTGLRYNCTTATTTYYLTLPEQARVSQTVSEIAGEIEVPLLKDVPLVKAFNVNGAARYTRYNTSGNYVTWKLGVDWQMTDTLRFRGTLSRDIRAPTLYELFAERFVVNVNGIDLLTGQSPVIPSINGGNPDLKAEIGNTLTGGVVWKPSRKFSLALDGYQIKVSDAILAVNGGDASFQAACYASGGASPYCALQRRPGSFSDTSAANAWTAVYNGLFNISEIKTWGADLEANFNSSLFNRPFMLRVLAAYQPHLWFRQPNVAARDQAGAAFGPVGFSATPTVRLTAFARFQPVERVTVDILQRWRNAMALSNDGVWAPGSNHMAPFGTTSLNISWDVKTPAGNSQLFLNIQNIFDATPPIGAFSGNGTRAGLRDGYAAGDDVRGRFWSAGFRFKM
ncbi:TonB-dependent receptor [Novosphingobium umbonatum]|uniref:TonB-dependent receptor n=1 Tax=Novosphingobium umbonatum TaxID=1908524 RepID=A0A437MXB6_9SPHN|nr:TonB-dependent receptor [Novosphingobium umbonatum]RVU02269.1 TonB-dependent receptor [Novosphingobium umbonatum]